MKTISAILSLIIVLGVGAAIAMDQMVVHGEWRYRITVEVETPEGIKSGSAVRQVSNSDMKPRILDLPDVGNPAEVIGEAVVVDLGERGKLFALISGASELYNAFPYNDRRGGQTTFEGIQYYNTLKSGMKVELPEKYWPTIVMFANLDDPKTVKLVRGSRFNPETQKHYPVDDFEIIFGPRIHLKSITIEITNELVTWEIEKTLPWLKTISGGYLHGGFTSKGAPLGLHGGNFKKGARK